PEDGCQAVCRKYRAMIVLENGTGLVRPPSCPLWPHARFLDAVNFDGAQVVHMSYTENNVALASGLGLWRTQLQAFEIETGPELTTSLASVVEFTSVYRTSSPERIERGGQNIFANNSDGSEYYDTGFVSNEFKLTSELHVRTEQDGLFVRGTAWYD